MLILIVVANKIPQIKGNNSLAAGIFLQLIKTGSDEHQS